jgi:hypothetical protein
MGSLRLGFWLVVVSGSAIAIAAAAGRMRRPRGLKGGGALNLYSARTISTFSGAFAPASPAARRVGMR